MKKSNKKLTLNRETLKALEQHKLKAAGGVNDPTLYPPCLDNFWPSYLVTCGCYTSPC